MTDNARGLMILHGGGSTTTEFRRRVLDLAGGPSSRVLAVPQGTTRLDIWSCLCDLWREAGAREAVLLDMTDPGRAIRQIEAADLVWITSGDQNRLMASLDGTGVPEALRQRFQAGATIGGTSAGASVVSAVMITGEPPDPDTGATHTRPGLGIWPEVIVDQHVLSRDRVGRLQRAVLDHPGLQGVGIDDDTAIVVRGGRIIEVEGTGAVIVADPRPGRTPVTTLQPGSVFDLHEGIRAGGFRVS